MRSTTTHLEIGLLLEAFDQAYNKKAWHGTNLRGSIRGLTPEEAAWRPGSGRHNIWEIVVHCAYWKYVVRRRILGEKRGSFPFKGSDWFRRPEKLSKEAWKADIELLDFTHETLREAIAKLRPSDLKTLSQRKKYTLRFEIEGIALHDVYHTGQIQMLKRLRRS